MEAGGDITIPDVDGRTPLYVTGFDGYVEAAGLLLKLRADLSITKDNGRTPLSLAVVFGYMDIWS